MLTRALHLLLGALVLWGLLTAALAAPAPRSVPRTSTTELE